MKEETGVKDNVHIIVIDKGGKKKTDIKCHNIATYVGRQKMLDVMFHSVTPQYDQITQWWIGLISASGYSAVVAADTMASNPGWDEAGTALDNVYNGANRIEWQPDVAAGTPPVIENSTAAVFTISAGTSTSIRGIFLVGDPVAANAQVKGGMTGTLWCAAVFGADVPIAAGDTVRITYGVTLNP